ncbi:LysR family transcriptional regulator [Staphylococcus caeli]|uniref:LysR family transcriptional regulator n=1 Tax=Staphylococcus caeli TaxID=2201815 RepID=UPI003F55E4CC
MELRSLRYFWTVAEEHSISKAAAVLNITQPTLSRQMQDLESELGTELFYRENKGIVLTEEGIFLKNRAEDILSLTNKTQQEFEDKKHQALKGHITIGCVEADNSDTLAMILEEMVNDHPNVTFHIVSGIGSEISEMLEKGLVDIAILIEPIATDKYEKIPLPRPERWGLLVSNDSALKGQSSIIPENLKDTKLLMSRRQENQNMIAKWGQTRVEDLQIIGTYNLVFNIFSLVQNNVGSAVVIEGVTRNRKLDNLAFIPFKPELYTHCVLVWKKK